MDLDIKRKERKALNSSLYSLTHRNARTIKLVSLRVRRIEVSFFMGDESPAPRRGRERAEAPPGAKEARRTSEETRRIAKRAKRARRLCF